MASLQDQLLKAGLVSKQQALSRKTEQKKQARKQRKGQAEVDQSKLEAEQLQKAQKEKSQALAKEQNALRQQKELEAATWQMLNQFQLQKTTGDVVYNFQFAGKVKQLKVTSRIQHDLADGRLSLCELREQFFILTRQAADKIAEKMPSVIVVKNEKSEMVAAEDDPYAEFQIPDDLMW